MTSHHPQIFLYEKKITQILFRLRSKGIRVWADNGRLHYQPSKEGPTAEEIETLRVLRDPILALLQLTNSPEKEARLTPRMPHEHVPLTFSQQLWYAGLNLEKRPGVRSLAKAARLIGHLDQNAMCKSVEILFNRHEALRTRITSADSGGTQHIDATSRHGLEIFDLTTLPYEKREFESKRLVEELAHEPVLLDTGPLFAARLLQLDKLNHILVIAAEHIISDAASIGIAWRDIFSAYTLSIQGQGNPSPKSHIQFPDYAVWQLKNHSSWMDQHATYWQNRLAGSTHTRLSQDNKIQHLTKRQWAKLAICFEGTLRNNLVQMSRRENTSLVMSILTSFAALIMRWTNTSSLLLPFTTAGRYYPDIESTIGFFGTPLLLRIDLFEEDTFTDLLIRVTNEYAIAYAHDDSCRMVTLMNKPELLLNPTFNWIPSDFYSDSNELGYKQQPADSLIIADYKFEIVPPDDEPNEENEPRIDLSDSNNSVIGEIGYRADLFQLTTIERLRRNLLFFAETLSKLPKTRVNSIALLQ